MNAPFIRPLNSAEEACHCAAFMAASDPWRTLGVTSERLFQTLVDSDREVHVATVDKLVVGVTILQLAGVLNGYIQILAMHPDWRNRGLGTQLMHFAEERIFRQSPNVFLCVSEFNHRAQKFYERLGYQRVGELKDFLAHGHSEILMRKTTGAWLEFETRR
jgi:ribosomal protein S18 acetylase RimI-like enzyme